MKKIMALVLTMVFIFCCVIVSFGEGITPNEIARRRTPREEAARKAPKAVLYYIFPTFQVPLGSSSDETDEPAEETHESAPAPAAVPKQEQKPVEIPKEDPKPTEAPKEDPKPTEAPKENPKPAEIPVEESNAEVIPKESIPEQSEAEGESAPELSLDIIEEKTPSEIVLVTFSNQSNKDIKEVEKGKPVEKPSVQPSQNGYTFLHWFNEELNKIHNFSDPIEADTTLLAVFEKLSEAAIEEDAAAETSDPSVNEEIAGSDATNENANEETSDDAETETSDEIVEENTEGILPEDEAGQIPDALQEIPADITNESIPNASIELISSKPTIYYGDLVTLVARAEGSLTFQWQYSQDGGTTWHNVEGQTSRELDIVITKENANNIWRVEISY